MKSLFSKISVLLILILSFAFLSCSMADDVSVYDNSVSYGNENFLYGKLSYSDNKDSVRTIIDRTPLDYNDYDFYMYGTNSANGQFDITPVTVDTSTGEFSMLLFPSYWNLTVFALKRGTTPLTDIDSVHSKAVLIGNAAADLSKSAANATFTMSVGNLTTGGSAYFNAVLSNDSGNTFWALPMVGPDDYKVYGCLKHIVTGEVIDGSRKSMGFTRDNDSGKNSGLYNAGPFTPGTYLFELEFYTPDNEFKGVWSDTIVITAGQTIRGEVYVPNVLGLMPAAPSDFYATYYTGSEDEGDYEGTYKLHFNWQDNANNESYFEIQLAEIEMHADWEGNTSWNDPVHSANIKNVTVFDRSYLTRPEYISGSGSMNANNSRITVYAKLGVQYQARIRSVNSFGGSDWVSVQIPSSRSEIPADTDKTLLSYFGEDYGDGSHASNCIHRGRITYNLCGGSYQISSDLRVYTPKVMYFTQMTPNRNDIPAYAWWTGPAYWDGTGYDNTDSTGIKLTDKKFRYWSSSPSGAATRYYDKTSGSIRSYKMQDNVTLYAEYEDDAGTSIDPAYRLLANWISYSVDGVDKGAVTNVADSRRAMVTLNKSDGAIVVFHLYIPGGEETYNFISAKVMDSSYSDVQTDRANYNSGAGYDFIINLNDAKWVNGLYEVEFAAEKVNPGSSSLYEKCYITLIVN